MKKKFILPLLALVASLSACSPFTLVNSETYNNADMANYTTFRIVYPEADQQLPDGMQMVTYYNIAAAIREQMVERGYTEDPNSPLLINFGVTVHREIETAPAYPPMVGYGPMSPGFGPGPWQGFYPGFIYPRSYYWNPNAKVITGIYKEGVLTVDMVNIDRKIPLFSASVATIIDGGQGQYRNLQGIAEAVQTLFSRFPVKPLPQYQNK